MKILSLPRHSSLKNYILFQLKPAPYILVLLMRISETALCINGVLHFEIIQLALYNRVKKQISEI
jgi:hypothetical protein